MGHLIRSLVAITTAVSAFLLASPTARAEDSLDSVSRAIATDLAAEVQEALAGNTSVTVSDFDINATPELAAQYLANPTGTIEELADYLLSSEVGNNLPAIMTPFGTKSYTSAVFAGVPAVGVCWIHQDFEATVTSGKITSKKLQGISYQTGVCVFAWSHNRSWFEQPSNTKLNVYSKGTFSAIVKGTGVSFAATFLAYYNVSGSGLVQDTQ